MNTEAAQEQGGHDVYAWRRDQLVGSGFPPALAARLARDPHFDLHALIQLTECGCPPELAVRILAPLDQDNPPA